ncbi:MAG: hypothetical protein EXQ91_07165 [Alphaproteobacteria bacterium]|nr:hypothetical protein [Alphaproteobacteria bacterium]
MTDTAKIIDELLARSLLPETRNDIEEYRHDLLKGHLDRGDERYVRALHARLLGGGGEPPPLVEEPSIDELEDEIAELRQQLAERDRRITELEQEIAALRAPKS